MKTQKPGKEEKKMSNPTSEEALYKKTIFDSMSAKRRQYILQKGYEKWNPFQEPKDPIDIRRDKSKRTSQALVRSFLQSRTEKEYSSAYSRGVLEICLGLINEDQRYQGMYDFACWYYDLLKKEGY